MESQRRSLQQRIERAREHIEGFEVEREAAQALPRRERREELARIDSWDERSRRETARLEVELADMPVVGDVARRELAVTDQILAQRRELAIIAARISPPAYVKNELGRGRAIRPCGRLGIAASRRSSATARGTASRTRTKPSGGRRNGEPSEHGSRRHDGGCKRHSERLAWDNTQRERGNSAEG